MKSNYSRNNKPPTKVLLQVGLDIVTSAMCKHQQRFGLDVQFSALVHNFNNIFLNGHLCPTGKSINSLPSQIPGRYVQLDRRFPISNLLKKYLFASDIFFEQFLVSYYLKKEKYEILPFIGVCSSAILRIQSKFTEYYG